MTPNQWVYECDSRGITEIQNFTLRDPEAWREITLGNVSDSGVPITPKSIINHTPIWQGLNIISGDVAMLPVMLKERLRDETTRENTRHTAYRLAAERANPIMWAVEFRELMQMRALVYGNGIAEVARDDRGRPLPAEQGGLTPLIPENTHPEYDENGRLWIMTRVQIGNTQREFRIDPIDTVHIKGLTADGIWGLSLQQVAQDTIGYGLALKKHGNVTFKNRARPDLILRHPGVLGDDAAQEMKKRWNEAHQGLDQTARVAVLEEDMQAQILGQTNEQAQFLEAMRFDREMVASLLNLPAHMLNALERATFSNIEEQSRWYVNRTLARWLNKWTKELWAKLLTRAERERFFFLHDVDQLLKGTLKDRAEAASKFIASKVLNSNEVREMEGWDPREGGDEYENPNTSTNAAPPQEQAEEDDRLQQIEDRQRRLLSIELQRAMRNENDAVLKAIRNGSDFKTWAQSFYREKWPDRLSEVIDAELAKQYCADRYDSWMEAAGAVETATQFEDLADKERAEAGERGRILLNQELLPCACGTNSAA